MSAEKIEKIRLIAEDMAGIIAGMDEESSEKIDKVKRLADIITDDCPFSSDVVVAVRRVRDAAESLKYRITSFDWEYRELCSAIDTLQKIILSLLQNEDRVSSAKIIPCGASLNETPQPSPDADAAASSFDNPEVMEELDMQLELLEGLLDVVIEKDAHLLGVIQDFFLKMGKLVSNSGEAVSVAMAGAAAADDVLAGGMSFDEGIQLLRDTARWFRNLLDGERRTKSGSNDIPEEDSNSDARSSGEAIGEFLESQSALLDEFESDVAKTEQGKAGAIQRLNENARILEKEATASGVLHIARIFEAVGSATHKCTGLPQAKLASALVEAKDFINDYFSEIWDDNEDLKSTRLDKIITALNKATDNQSNTSNINTAKELPEITAPVVVIDTNNPELLEFITESREYLHASEMALLELEKAPGKQECVNEVFRGFHNIKGIAGFLSLKDVQEVAHHAESLLERVRCGELELVGPAAHAAFAALDFLKDMIERVNDAMSGIEYEAPSGYANLISKLKNPGEAGEAPIIQRSPDYPKDEAVKEEENGETGDSVFGQAAVRNAKAGGGKADGMVKVSTTRLDMLIDAVGELVIANAMVTQEPEITGTKSPRLARNVSQLGKITRELQELAMSMRMVSLKNTFQKMTRLGRDLSIKCGAPVELTFSGEDTEVDRNVVEEISSPLVHMVRNAVDHGIETPDERRALGKPDKGRIHLSAAHEGGTVVIRISDDGRGLSKEAILSKAVALNLVSPDAMMSDREIYNLIFQPGFSTAKKVTDVSGRGVGMDVVRRSIDELRGRIEIESESGKGTNFTIRLPLTLAIIDGMVVTVAAERYIIPTIAIVESLRPEAGQISTVIEKGEMLSVRGDLMPLFRLHRLFDLKGAKTDATNALAVIVGGNGSRCALMVDNLVGQQQVVIKTLGKTFAQLDGVSGGAIMGDGRVALILDTTGMVRLAHGANLNGRLNIA